MRGRGGGRGVAIALRAVFFLVLLCLVAPSALVAAQGFPEQRFSCAGLDTLEIADLVLPDRTLLIVSDISAGNGGTGCRVVIRNVVCHFVFFSGDSITGPNASITIDNVVCLGGEVQCIDIAPAIRNIDFISVRNVVSTSVAAPTGFRACVMFLNSVDGINSITVSNYSSSTSQPSAFAMRVVEFFSSVANVGLVEINDSSIVVTQTGSDTTGGVIMTADSTFTNCTRVRLLRNSILFSGVGANADVTLSTVGFHQLLSGVSSIVVENNSVALLDSAGSSVAAELTLSIIYMRSVSPSVGSIVVRNNTILVRRVAVVAEKVLFNVATVSFVGTSALLATGIDFILAVGNNVTVSESTSGKTSPYIGIVGFTMPVTGLGSIVVANNTVVVDRVACSNKVRLIIGSVIYFIFVSAPRDIRFVLAQRNSVSVRGVDVRTRREHLAVHRAGHRRRAPCRRAQRRSHRV
jgi:hypothetical protein